MWAVAGRERVALFGHPLLFKKAERDAINIVTSKQTEKKIHQNRAIAKPQEEGCGRRKNA